jgi:hypothetical protein
MTRIDAALEEAGLSVVLEARRRSGAAPWSAGLAGLRDRLAAADLLLLGAMADRVREDEAGDVVRVTLRSAGAPDGGALVVRAPDVPPHARGLALLRAVAMARLESPEGARVAIDWSDVGLELAQVALSFGANEIVGSVVSKRGLPIAEDATKKVKGEGMVPVLSLKKRELGDLLRRMGREPSFVDELAHDEDDGGGGTDARSKEVSA